ncbi:YeeE/YedE family protein [Spongiibacter nanhainus]|uniref:YeeE/YedE family protein n=1 Tax=Spongiibacter nanhainus TaxID=2794344 RepID=A0A7T4URU9_9GAMM|nr:YeeE/YedE family protein [Spongiibacter nanhainus]QQD19643.1 YeeE/YedE family protein [Spongiibacter nanhainus]
MVEATAFTPISSLLGGALIGGSAVLLMFSIGRIAGISGIVAGAAMEKGWERNWRLLFVVGLFVGAALVALSTGALANSVPVASTTMMVIGGIVVGFGARLGSGCTSGHGVCGISRLSARSIVATGTFMASGMVTVFILRHVLGEGL